MAYKPYKVNKGESPRFKNSTIQKSSSIKLFGFRTGYAHRMLPAIAYYLIVTFTLITSIVNEVRYYQFTESDIILDVSKYLFIGIMLYSPALFLSDFKYVDSLPFFKKKKLGSSVIGLILVFCFCYFMWNVDIFCMSQKYKDSVEAYSIERQQQIEKQLEGENTESATKLETTNNDK